MKRLTTSQFSVPHEQPMTLAQQARTVAFQHGEKILAEVPTTLRRVGQFMLVLSITIPAFLAGLLVVLWHFAK